MMRRFVGQCVRGVTIFVKLRERAEHDVRAGSGLAAQPVPGEQIIGSLQIIGNDDEEIPVAGGRRLSACAAAKQADLKWSEFVDDTCEQMVDRLNVERLSSNISGFGHDHDVSLPSTDSP